MPNLTSEQHFLFKLFSLNYAGTRANTRPLKICTFLVGLMLTPVLIPQRVLCPGTTRVCILGSLERAPYSAQLQFSLLVTYDLEHISFFVDDWWLSGSCEPNPSETDTRLPSSPSVFLICQATTVLWHHFSSLVTSPQHFLLYGKRTVYGHLPVSDTWDAISSRGKHFTEAAALRQSPFSLWACASFGPCSLTDVLAPALLPCFDFLDPSVLFHKIKIYWLSSRVVGMDDDGEKCVWNISSNYILDMILWGVLLQPCVSSY